METSGLIGALRDLTDSFGKRINPDESRELWLSFLAVLFLYLPFWSRLHYSYSHLGVYCASVIIVWMLLASRRAPAARSRRHVSPVVWFLACIVLMLLPIDLFRPPAPESSRIVVSVLVLASAIVLTPLLRRIEGFLSDRQALKVTMIVLGFCAFTYFYIGQNFGAAWGIIDDHEIMQFLGPDGKTYFREIPGLLMNTEAGQWSVRFRPSYYFLRLVETSLWGESYRTWYVMRTVMFATSMAFFWLALSRWIRPGLSALVLMYCLTYPFWGDIWCRLGPSEAYGALGMSLFAFSFVTLLYPHRLSQGSRRSVTVVCWVMLTVGALAAIGSKENFVLLVVPSWFLAAMMIIQRRLSITGAICTALITSYAAFVAFHVIVVLLRAGTDLYGNSVAPTSRLALGWEVIQQISNSVNWLDIGLGIVLIGSAAYLIKGRDTFNSLCTTFGKFLLIALGLLFLYTSQYIFYSGAWPLGGRYNFPGILAVPFFWITLAFFGLKILGTMGMHRHVIAAVKAGLIVGLCISTAGHGFSKVRMICRWNVEKTQAFTARLTESVELLKVDPDRPLVLVCYSISCYEPVLSLARFMRAKGVQNPLFLDLKTIPCDTPFTSKLCDHLRNISEKGAPDFTPLDQLDPANAFFVIGLGGEPDIPGGESLGNWI